MRSVVAGPGDDRRPRHLVVIGAQPHLVAVEHRLLEGAAQMDPVVAGPAPAAAPPPLRRGGARRRAGKSGRRRRALKQLPPRDAVHGPPPCRRYAIRRRLGSAPRRRNAMRRAAGRLHRFGGTGHSRRIRGSAGRSPAAARSSPRPSRRRGRARAPAPHSRRRRQPGQFVLERGKAPGELRLAALEQRRDRLGPRRPCRARRGPA